MIGQSQRQGRKAHTKAQQFPQQFALLLVNSEEECRKNPYQQLHHKLTHRSRRVRQLERIIAQAHHEVNDGGKAHKEHATAHSLAIEDHKESQVDQRRTGLLLQNNQH